MHMYDPKVVHQKAYQNLKSLNSFAVQRSLPYLLSILVLRGSSFRLIYIGACYCENGVMVSVETVSWYEELLYYY